MSETWLHNPDLPFTKEGVRGNRLVNDRFVNHEDMQPISFGKAMKWMFQKNPQRAEKKSDRFRLPLKKDTRIFTESADAFCWLGHAAFLFRINGKLLLTDPCLGSSTGLKRLVDSPFSFEEMPGLDYVLFTHTHRDHFDERSIRLLLKQHPEIPFLVPLRVAPLLRKLGAKNITEAGWYQHFNNVPHLDIHFLPAHHWNRRWLNDTNRELWGSFVLRSEKRTIYFAGDTAYANHFAEIGALHPEISHAFMPIGAYKPTWMMERAHTSPQQAVQGFNELGAKTFIPMHFGTYDLSDEPISEPLRLVQQLHADGALKGDLLAPAVGETVFL